MRRLFFALLISLMVTPSVPAVAENGFVSVIDDLPLVDGLAEDMDAALVFETSTGRIATAEARGLISRDAIQRFYDTTLPQLGWERTKSLVYVRDGEQLVIDVKDDPAPGLLVRFSVGPVDGG